MKASVDTRKLYRFEALFLHIKGQPGNEDTPIGVLRSLADRTWLDFNKSSHECPPIISGEGLREGDTIYSYYEVHPVHKIVLARHQRRPVLLYHELTHALGCGLHNERFCSLYFTLLHRYLGYDLDELRLQAANFKIRT